MLSKEEIEKAKENLTFFNEGDYITKEMSDSKNVLLIYIDQLESDKQKLIEKLEEDKETLKKESADGTLQDYVIRLLEILKGENQVTVK